MLSRIYFMGDDVYPTFLHDDDRDMDLFNFIHDPNPTKVKTDTRPRATHEVPVLTITSTIGGKSFAAIGLCMGSTFLVPTSHDTPVDVSNLGPLSFANPQSIPTENVAQRSEIKEYLFYLHGWVTRKYLSAGVGVTNGCRLDALEACQDLMDHIMPPGYFSELCHLHNNDFLK
nr:hypothetical protein [Tanacetum cinerariifolium]